MNVTYKSSREEWSPSTILSCSAGDPSKLIVIMLSAMDYFSLVLLGISSNTSNSTAVINPPTPATALGKFCLQ